MVRSLVDILTSRAAESPERLAYRYLTTGESDTGIVELSYGRLDERAKAIAVWLRQRGLVGGRALLLYPPGLDFVCGYLGCLAAGVVAVPGVPPQGRSQNHRALTRMKRLIADANAEVILGTRQLIDSLRPALDSLGGLEEVDWVATDEVPDELAADWREPDLTADSVAFLQYTSGSTSAPRGVMVTHGNLLDNQRVMTEWMGHTPEALTAQQNELYVSWLPVYHDMGLIAPVLNTIYLGGTSTLFSPLHFLQKPERWLDAVSRYRPHTSGGPNFAYELCLRDATPELLDRLDLSDWRCAFNGAEPVRATTLRRFTEVFAPAGFRHEAHFPCYGLAEATLMVSGGPADEAPLIAVRPGEDVEVVSCGRPRMPVVIADPEQRTECAEGENGEIWVAGASVARGYWRNTLATREAFRAALPDGRGGFLRTGDLGFLKDGELFVTGRVKDLLVIDGRNHYPQDLELTAELSHPGVRPGCAAAFSVEDDGAERPVIVAEASTDAAPELAEITALIRSTVSEAHELSLRDVVLIRPGSIPKTSSGKIQRQASRAAYLDGSLAVLGAADHV
jgi:polyketide synthase 12